ncbi:hypothetical protein J2T60_001506 [Natronospira proteinivora]|uniref:Uncharacterized protein n=1 Tax=Natronospira proteinivora TaxID=1807133 RepID=A0ABT1G872_9GAMM|nr:hypothetical protein [Natronospira proteinivora]MCP1727506.1 hypothetical protein [Natronospira proteinivora]
MITTNSAGLRAARIIFASAVVGFFTALFFYEADVFWQDTGFVFGVALVTSFYGLSWSRVGRLHHLYWHKNSAIGLARLGVIASVLWCAYVLSLHADPTITGIWTVLYALMAFAAIKFFGQLWAEFFGPRLRIDVYERKNLAAAIFIAAFTLATGMIFGGAMWGSMTAESLEYGSIFEVLPGYEDGWWITPWFFLMGWTILALTQWLWIRREKANFADRIVRDHRINDAKAAAGFCLSNAVIITYAVHGDYHGFGDSLFGFSLIALPVLAHELMRPRTPDEVSRDGEWWVYIVVALGSVLLMPWLSTWLGLRL